jgi:hypothetical protein
MDVQRKWEKSNIPTKMEFGLPFVMRKMEGGGTAVFTLS